MNLSSPGFEAESDVAIALNKLQKPETPSRHLTTVLSVVIVAIRWIVDVQTYEGPSTLLSK